MQCAVYDTYVARRDGIVMHFDIIVPHHTSFEAVISFGKKHLESVDQAGQKITAQECRFCHIEKASPEVENTIHNQGYYILAMQGCPAMR
jgi:hypothetical protein